MVLATRQGYSVDVESHEKVGSWRPSTKLLDWDFDFYLIATWSFLNLFGTLTAHKGLRVGV